MDIIDIIDDLKNMETFEKAHSFKMFDAFGIMPAENAIGFINAGLFRVEEISVLPLSQTLTVVHLTKKGRFASKNFLKVWNLAYEPILEVKGAKLVDEYSEAKEIGLQFVMSQSRFNAERKAGRLSRVISMCPNILQ